MLSSNPLLKQSQMVSAPTTDFKIRAKSAQESDSELMAPEVVGTRQLLHSLVLKTCGHHHDDHHHAQMRHSIVIRPCSNLLHQLISLSSHGFGRRLPEIRAQKNKSSRKHSTDHAAKLGFVNRKDCQN